MSDREMTDIEEQSEDEEHSDQERPMLLDQAATEAVLNDLRDTLDHTKTNALFTCGGKVSTAECESVSLRWDSSDPQLNKLDLPSENYEALDQLLKDCEAATFGYKDKDVLDETYRKASKMEPSQFCTNFNPYELGIIDSIQQLLYPCLLADPNFRTRRVRAELYKLNVYSGPTGMFKSHVDTPRSELQFGSLVVCLPCSHQGGALVVRHEKTEVIHNWSNDAKSIQWAAFYSDCEHEVLKVEAGHRITLTYNLYDFEGAGGVLNMPATMNSTAMPLYIVARGLLEQPPFFAEGGVLGFHCSHAYAHHEDSVDKFLPRALKGIDMAVYRAFRGLGVSVHLRPVYKWSDGSKFRDAHCGFKNRCELCRLTGCPSPNPNSDDHNDGQNDEPDGEDDDDILWIVEEEEEEGGETWPADLIGTRLQPQQVHDDMREEDEALPLSHCAAKNIVWLNDNIDDVPFPGRRDDPIPKRKRRSERIAERRSRTQIGLVSMVYGNNAEISCTYSSLALFICIPPFAERKLDSPIQSPTV